MGKWALASGPEMVPVPIDPKHFKQLLAEIADILYDSYCQLSRIKKSASQPVGTQDSQTGRSQAAERKGSHE